MATDVTIAPSLGSPVLLTDGGVGASPGYSAIDWRRIIQASGAFQEGVFDATGWKVTERATSTNLSVDVAANVGLAVVKGDSVTNQGLYVVAPHSAVINLDVASNSSGNPRKDYVILQVRDSTHDASGSYDARVRILTGTPTSGATQDNTLGQPTIPNGAILLAQLLVPTGTTSAVTNSMIRDRRPWARGVYCRIVRNANGSAGSNYTTTSTTAAAIDATNLNPRVEAASGALLRASIRGRMLGSAAGLDFFFGIRVDGTAADGGDQFWWSTTGTGYGMLFDLSWDVLVASGGSLRIAPYWRVNSGTATIHASATTPLQFTIEEIDRASASNGTV